MQLHKTVYMNSESYFTYVQAYDMLLCSWSISLYYSRKHMKYVLTLSGKIQVTL